MIKRVLLLLAGLAAVLGVAVWFDRSLDPINPATFERIKLGMSIEQIALVLGRDKDELNITFSLLKGSRGDMIMKEVGSINSPADSYASWIGRQFAIVAKFDRDDVVFYFRISRLEAARPSVHDRIRGWLAGW